MTRPELLEQAAALAVEIRSLERQKKAFNQAQNAALAQARTRLGEVLDQLDIAPPGTTPPLLAAMEKS